MKACTSHNTVYSSKAWKVKRVPALQGHSSFTLDPHVPLLLVIATCQQASPIKYLIDIDLSSYFRLRRQQKPNTQYAEAA